MISQVGLLINWWHKSVLNMMSWTSLSDSGMLRLLWIILGLTGGLSVGVNGLKCYICQIDMEGCRLDVTPKASVYLQECAPSAIACASFYGEKRYTGELWFQRLCFYPPDPEHFWLDANNLPDAKDGKVYYNYFSFFFWVGEANEARMSASLPLIAQPSPTLGFDGNSDFLIKTQTCNNSDGCNDWQGVYQWKYADNYPKDWRSTIVKLRGMGCYECRVTDPYQEYAYTCLREDPIPYYTLAEDIWFDRVIHLDQLGYGCTTIAIYQTSDYGLEPYFERNVWVPGDYWCLLRKYKSSPDQDNYIQYSKQGEAEGGKENKGSCRAGYLRSLEQEDADAKYSWVGHRVFHTVDEFSDFLLCKAEVRKKLWWSYLDNEIRIPFNETAVREKIKENYWEARWSGPFAYVGFRFCGPDVLCNTWSAEKLYNIMDKPPTTTTTTTTTTTRRTTTTTPSTTTPTSTTTGFGKGINLTIYPEEIPDDGCETYPKNQAVQFTGLSSKVILLSPFLSLFFQG